MSRRALHCEQRLDCLDYVTAAITDVRACIEIAPDVGPVLVASYRALSALGELREAVDAMPVVEAER
jgi:hypothetical protein